MKKKLRLALLISQGGTTATAIIQACKKRILAIEPVLVIASSDGISGIKRVYTSGILKKDILVIDPLRCKDRKEFAEKLLVACEKRNVDIVGQYGWLPHTPKEFVNRYEGKIINQHCGPLDSSTNIDFGGKGMWARRVHCAILYFRRVTNHDLWTEATTHLVTAEFDKGAVIKREKVSILSDDTIESLQARVLEVEYAVQIEALNDFAHNRVKILKRSKPLIKKSEKKILEEAKRIAGILYPNG